MTYAERYVKILINNDKLKISMNNLETINNMNNLDRGVFRGKSWLLRLPVLFFMFYLLCQDIANPNYFGFIRYFDLLIHESGHWIFMFFGETLTVLGGSLLQIIIPIVFIFAFWKQSDYFAITFCFSWLGDNLFYVATYIADARARKLILLGGDTSGHDWYNLLSGWNLLAYDTIIASAVQFLAATAMIAGVFFGSWILWIMYKSKTQ